MKKETLKDWCKEWSIEEIVGNIYSEGIRFALDHPQLTQEDVDEYKKIIIREINRRMK